MTLAQVWERAWKCVFIPSANTSHRASTDTSDGTTDNLFNDKSHIIKGVDKR